MAIKRDLEFLFNEARKNGHMDRETQQEIFHYFADSFSCIPLFGSSYEEKTAKAPKNWLKGWEIGSSQRLVLQDFDTDMIGLICGPHNGIIVLDVDDWDKFNKYLSNHGYTVSKTFTAKTKNGYHFYYKYPEDGKKYGNRMFKEDGFDIKAFGGYVVAPGSLHPEGGYYDVTEWNLFAEAPQWLLDLCLYLDKAKPDHITEQTFPDSHIINQANTASQQSVINSSQIIDAFKSKIPDDILEELKTCPPKGKRSEIIARVMVSLVNHNISDNDIKLLFNIAPLGEKIREKGEKFFLDELKRAKDFVKNNPAGSVPMSKQRKINVIQELITLMGKHEYFVDENGEYLCKIYVDGVNYFFNIKSEEFMGQMRDEIWAIFKIDATFNQFKMALSSLKKQLKSPKFAKPIYSMKRFFQDNNRILYDPARSDNMAVEITNTGVKFIPQPDILYRRNQDIIPDTQIDLSCTGLDNFKQMLDLFEIPDDYERHYLLVHILSFLFDNIATPYLYLYGMFGSGKTTFAIAIRNIFDHSIAGGTLFSDDIRDLISQVSNSGISIFDNFDKLTPKKQNALSNAYSNGKYSYRKMYTNNETGNAKTRCPMIFTSLEVPPMQADLISRTVFIEIIPKTENRSEIEIADAMNLLYPKIRGELLNLASKVIGIISSFKSTGITRHSDFEKLAQATISLINDQLVYNSYTNGNSILWDEFLKFISSSKPVVSSSKKELEAIINIIRHKGIYFFTMAELSEDIKNAIGSDTYNGNAASIGKLVTKYKSELNSAGIILFEGKKINSGRVYMAADKNSSHFPFGFDRDKLNSADYITETYKVTRAFSIPNQQ